MAELKLPEVKKIATKAELELYQLSRGRSLNSLSREKLQQQRVRARDVRKKWRDQLAEQRRAAQQSKKVNPSATQLRSQLKVQMAEEILERFENRIQAIDSGEAKAPAPKSSSSSPTKSTRNREERASRAAVRKELNKKQKKLMANEDEPAKKSASRSKHKVDAPKTDSTNTGTTTSASKSARSKSAKNKKAPPQTAQSPKRTAKTSASKSATKTATKSSSKSASQSAPSDHDRQQSIASQKNGSGLLMTGSPFSLENSNSNGSVNGKGQIGSTRRRPNLPSSNSNGHVESAQIDSVHIAEVNAAAKQDIIDKTGLTNRVLGHVSAAGRRNQAAKNARKRT